MKFPLDGTGSASSNRVLGETIEIVNGNAQYNNLVFLSAAPFYSENFVLTLTDAGGAVRTLTLGKDYRFFLKVRRTDEVANNAIYGALKLLSNVLTGTLTISYQSLGGEMVVNQGQVIAYLGSNVFNNNIAYEALVPYPAVRIPETASFDWPMDSIANVSQALVAKGFISWGAAYLVLPAADAIYNSDGLQETGTGESVTPGLGDTVKVEGGNTTPVNIAGTVAATLPVEQFALLAKNEAIERLITAVQDNQTTISLDNANIQIDNAAQETGGNLEKITSVTGVVTDPAYAGNGSGTLVSLMKGLYAKLTGVLDTRQLNANTDTVTTVPSGTQNVSLVNTPVVYVDNLPATQQVAGQVQVSNLSGLAQDNTLQQVVAALGTTLATRPLASSTDTVKVEGGNAVALKVDASATTQPVSASSLPLPSNAAKETGGNLEGLKTAVGTTDDAAWEGSTAMPASLASVLKGVFTRLSGVLNTRTLSSTTDSVKIQGGNTTGVLIEGGNTIPVVVDASGFPQPVVINTIPLAANAAKENGNLATIATTQGTGNDSAYAGTGSTTVVGALKGLYTALTGMLNTRALTSGTDSITTVPSGTQAVSASALPLPTGAAQETGNLATISQATGTQSDAAYAGAGNTTLVGGLKGLYAAIKGTLSIRALTSATDSVTIQGGNSIAVKVDGSAVIQPVSGNVTANIGTTNGLALDSSVQTLINTLKAKNDITSSVWVDPTTSPDTYYIRRETIDGNGAIVIAFENLAGGPVTPNAANLVSSTALASLSVQTSEHVTTSAGTGYDAGQVLIHSYAIDMGSGTPTMAFSVWFNATLNTTLAAVPDPATYSETAASSISVSASVLPTGAAQESGNLATLTTNTGATNAAAYVGSGNTTVIGALKGLYAALTGTLITRALTSATDTVKVEGGNTAAVKVDNSAVTQPISATALPLPANAAKETGGNLDALNTAHGTSADAAYTGAGNGSLIAVAKGIFAAIKGTLNTRALTSGTDSVTVVPSGTQAISATTLPLPTGAATETGNLATIATAAGAPNSVVYAGSGTTTIIGALKGLYAALTGTLTTRALTSATDTVKVEGGNAAAVKVDGSNVTQPVSVAALPLPSGAATETGNLATIATASGTPSDVVYSGSGNTSILGALKGVYAAIKGTLNTRQLASATDSVTIQGGNSAAVKVDGSAVTQPVSVIALPLPSGAAQETGGNLEGLKNTVGTTADNAYTGTGTGTVISLLKAVMASVSGVLNTRVLTSGTDSVTTVPSGTQAVSVTSLPLPTGAATETGNLAAIKLATGVQSDAAYAGSGSTTLVGALKGLYAALTGTLITRALTSATDSVTIQGGNATAVKVDGSAVTQPVSGAVTANIGSTNGLALDSTVQTLINTLKAKNDITSSVWVDPTTTPDTYYIRRETIDGNGAIAIAFETLAGVTATPNAANLIASSQLSSLTVQSTEYVATAAGTGYASGNVLVHSYAIDLGTGTPTMAFSVWFNVTQSTTLAVPPASTNYVEATASSVSVSSSALPTGAAQESGNLATIATTTGSTNAVAYAGTGATTLVGVLKGIYLTLVGTLNTRVLTAANDSVKVEGGNTTAVKTDGSAVVQPVSATALPLPTDAATETGNLAIVAAAAGAPGDVAYGGSGTGTTISLLKSLYNKLAGTLSIRALTAGTDSVTIQGGNSTAVKVDGSASLQPVSVASLPLPTGAAQETGGNLAAINTAHGTIADSAYAGAGNGSLISVAKGIYAAIKGTLNIRALTSGTDSITTVPSGTQAVSASSLPLPTGAATETGNLASIATTNSTIATAQGTSASGVSQMSGGVGILGWLSGIYSRLSNTLPVSLTSLPSLPAGFNTIGKVDVNSLPALSSGANAIGTVGVTSLPALPAGANTIGSVAVTNFPATQAVSLVSQPLPTGAATETGNLATIATAQGNAATGTTMPTGGVGILGWLSGIYTKLASTLSVSVTSLPSLPTGTNTIGKVEVTSLPALPAGGNAIGTVQVSNLPATQAVSMVSAPLPANAAQETGGNLAAINVAIGSKTDSAWLGTGTSYSSTIGVLKGIFFLLMDTLNTRPLTAATDSVAVEGGNATAVKTDGSAVTQPISAATLPLPTGAATESTLASLEVTNDAMNVATGTTSDIRYVGTGTTTIVGALKGIYAVLTGTINTRTLSYDVDTVSAVVPQLPPTLGQKTKTQSTSVVLASDQPAVPVTVSGGGLALDSTVQTLIDTIKTKGSTTSSVWVDKTVVPEAYYIRRETYDSSGNVVIAFETLTGSQATPNAANLVPSDSEDTLSVHTQQYLATAASLAFDQDDVLIYTYAMNIRNPATPTLVYSYWFNATKGVLLASPPELYLYEMFGNPYLQSGGGQPVENAAKEAGGNLESINTTLIDANLTLADANSTLVSIQSNIGNMLTTLWSGSDTEPATVLSMLKALYAKLAGTLSIRALTAANDSVTVEGGNTTAVKVDGTATTQPISAASLPLPTGAAKETGGNLTSIATNTSNAVTALGSGATGITIPAGGVGVMGWLSGIYNKLSNALTVTVSSLPALPAGANTIGNVGVTSLPALPTGGNTIGAVNAVQSGSWTVSGQASTAAPNLSNGTTNPLSLTTTGGLRVDGSAVIQPVQIQAGSNAIGNVGVTSLPALPAGANAIGSVQVTSLPALPTGSNAIGTVGVSSLPALPAGANSIGSVNAVQSGVWTMSAAVTTAAPAYSTGTNQNLSLNTAGALRVDASGTTQAVSLAALPALAAGSAAIGTVGVTSLPALPAGANTIGNVGVTSLPALPAGGNNIGSVNAVQSGAWSINNSAKVVATPPTYTAGTDQPLTLNTAGYLMVDASDYTVPAQLVAGTASIGTVQAPAITKGNQDANGFSVQQLKDGGRNQTNYFMVKPVVSTATDVLQSLTGYKSGAAVAATTTPAVVTAGKRYRIVNIQITYVGIATLTHVVVTLRANTAGVVALTSPAVEAWSVGTNTAVAGSTQMLNIPIPEGMEFAAGTGIGVSVQGYGATGTAAAAGRVSVAIKGFEY